MSSAGTKVCMQGTNLPDFVLLYAMKANQFGLDPTLMLFLQLKPMIRLLLV